LEILHGLQNANGAAPIRASAAHAQEAIAEREAGFEGALGQYL